MHQSRRLKSQSFSYTCDNWHSTEKVQNSNLQLPTGDWHRKPGYTKMKWDQMLFSKCQALPRITLDASSRQLGGAKLNICSQKGSQETTRTSTFTSWHRLLTLKQHVQLLSTGKRNANSTTVARCTFPSLPTQRGVHTCYLQFGTLSKPCLSYVNMFICFYKIVLFTHRQSKEHAALSARLAVTIIITFTISADILVWFPVQMSCIIEYIHTLCALVSRNANEIQ